MLRGLKFLTGPKQTLNNRNTTTTRELLVQSPATFWKGTIFFRERNLLERAAGSTDERKSSYFTIIGYIYY